jgi:ribonuclease HI
MKYATRLQFKAVVDKCSNNIAEYEAVLLGLSASSEQWESSVVFWKQIPK